MRLYMWRTWEGRRLCDAGYAWGRNEGEARQIASMCLGDWSRNAELELELVPGAVRSEVDE